MAVTGITDQMMQYSKATEAIYNKKPKNGKAYGINRLDTKSIVAILAGLFMIFVVIAQLM